MYREQRIVTRCEVEYERQGRRIRAISEDLSVRGVFVRTDELLAVGAVVELHIHLPQKVATAAEPGAGPDAAAQEQVPPDFRVVSRVAHLLTPEAAAALGRWPGMGFEFLEHDNTGRERLLGYLGRLSEEVAAARIDAPPASHPFAVVADPSDPLLDRLENALGAAGFETLLFSNGGEALAACYELIPDVVLAALDMPVMDGLTLLARLREKAQLADVPVVLLASDASDFTRLEAYRLGVRDIIPRPFTDEELCIRVRRAAVETRRPPAEPVLRGSLVEITVATLLSLFEFERKSGVLHIRREGIDARLFVASGRVVKVDGLEGEGGARERIMHLLDWRHGRFEFNACEVVTGDELGLETQHLLLEHARVRDEEADGAQVDDDPMFPEIGGEG